jgi:hypothetical protein
VGQDFDDPFEEERAFARYLRGRRETPPAARGPLPRVRARLSPPLRAERAAPEPEPAEPLAARGSEPVRELSWIEIALQNPDGSPLANEPYRIKLPDGALREGKLGANGKIRLNDIPVGECEISFPNHDA